jgi:lactate dehydrogenase-like 2-hydroxyacid dehydrogenase
MANYGVGFSHIDLGSAKRHGIAVTNTPDVLSECTADLAMMLLLMVARRAGEGERELRAGGWTGWRPTHLVGTRVSGKTLGIVGFGRIGQAVARRARGFGMTILYHDVARVPDDVEADLGATVVPLDELLGSSDFVSLHVNLTAETHHLIDAARLRSMKSTAVLVNTARGPVVDGRALHDALRDGVIAAAALDVTEPEPLPPDDPLLSLENCLVVPHIASASRATRGLMAEMAAANLLAGLRGDRLPNPVNPEVYGVR